MNGSHTETRDRIDWCVADRGKPRWTPPQPVVAKTLLELAGRWLAEKARS